MMRAWLVAGLVALSALGCTGADQGYNDDGSPEWVNRGSGAVKEDGKRVFYGVGMVSGIYNRALARTTAENRARAEIGKIFRTYSASLMRDYMAATTAGTMDTTSEEQHIDQTIKTFSAVTLNGVVITDHWVDQDGTVYALARLDLAEFNGALQEMAELDAKTRDFVRANAEKAFDRLNAEENRHVQ